MGSGTPGTAGGGDFMECKNICNANIHLYIIMFILSLFKLSVSNSTGMYNYCLLDSG